MKAASPALTGAVTPLPSQSPVRQARSPGTTSKEVLPAGSCKDRMSTEREGLLLSCLGSQLRYKMSTLLTPVHVRNQCSKQAELVLVPGISSFRTGLLTKSSPDNSGILGCLTGRRKRANKVTGDSRARSESSRQLLSMATAKIPPEEGFVSACEAFLKNLGHYWKMSFHITLWISRSLEKWEELATPGLCVCSGGQSQRNPSPSQGM